MPQIERDLTGFGRLMHNLNQEGRAGGEARPPSHPGGPRPRPTENPLLEVIQRLYDEAIEAAREGQPVAPRGAFEIDPDKSHTRKVPPPPGGDIIDDTDGTRPDDLTILIDSLTREGNTELANRMTELMARRVYNEDQRRDDAQGGPLPHDPLNFPMPAPYPDTPTELRNPNLHPISSRISDDVGLESRPLVPLPGVGDNPFALPPAPSARGRENEGLPVEASGPETPSEAAANERAERRAPSAYPRPSAGPTGEPAEDMLRYRAAIASIESAGQPDPYRALGPVTRNGDRAYGKYQVMGNNIGPWSREALGRSVTVAEFLASPHIQDAIFDHRFGSYIDNFGSPEAAAQAWFGGPGSVGRRGRADLYGTTVGSYSNRFLKAIGQTPQQGGPAGALMAEGQGQGPGQGSVIPPHVQARAQELIDALDTGQTPSAPPPRRVTRVGAPELAPLDPGEPPQPPPPPPAPPPPARPRENRRPRRVAQIRRPTNERT